MNLRVFSRIALWALWVAFLAPTGGCVYAPSQKIPVIRFADGELVVRRYKKLGITAALPQNVMDLSVWSQRWYQRETGHKTLSFVLGKALTRPDETPFWTGSVNVYDANADVESRSFSHSDTILIESLSYQRLGWDQKVFLFERRAEDGRRLRASITYAEYGGQLRKESDLNMITNILQSVSFSARY